MTDYYRKDKKSPSRCFFYQLTGINLALDQVWSIQKPEFISRFNFFSIII